MSPTPRRILYERLDRSTGWFEAGTAIRLGDGLNKGHASNRPFGKGMVRATDGETGEPAWVQYAWNLLGVAPGSDGRLDHWQVTLDTAGQWFSQNRVDPHELWFEDQKCTIPAKYPVQAEPPAPGTRPPIPEGSATPGKGNHTSGFAPSVEQLVEVHQSLWWFADLLHSSRTTTLAQEADVLPRFVRLADALRPVRGLIDNSKGWPTKVRRALREVVTAFDATARLWGWEGIAQPEPARSAYLAQCSAWVEESLERPMYEGALAISAGWNRPEPCRYDDMADEARRRGMAVTIGLEEGLGQVEAARTLFNRQPHFGRCYPTIGEQEAAALTRAFNILHPAMQGAAPDRCSRPPWQQTPGSQPVAASDPPEAPSPVDNKPIVATLRVICPLHGIRTLAQWQKGLSDLASSRGWVCRLDRWSYGRFSLLAFLTPWTREAKLNWLRRQYDAEINDRRLDIEQGQAPSVVAHSFGTYILGYTLIRFDFIRFNKVILCGSILPRDFPWDKLIARGQVQAVRNEYGVRDPWVKRIHRFVRGTGPSGACGFTSEHARLEQEEFEYDHSDYFGTDHMDDRWMPFLSRSLEEIPRSKDGPRVPRPRATAPWGLYGLVAMAIVVAVVIGSLWSRRQGTIKRDQSYAARSAGAGTTLARIPSAENLASLAAALKDLLDTFEKYKLFLDKPSETLDNVMPQRAMLESLCRLEKLLNPRRLPYGSAELATYVVRAWPYEVMTAYPKLRSHAYRIIERWDIPEICQDRPFMRGKYGVTRDDGTIKEIDRPTRPYSLTSVERDELAWVLSALLEALRTVDQVIPNTPVSPPGTHGKNTFPGTDRDGDRQGWGHSSITRAAG